MPIPDKLWKKILEFLVAGKMGSIVLHVHDGNIVKMELNEHVRI